MDRYRNALIAEGRTYWAEGEPVPLDLAVAMMAEGMDVDALEAKYRKD